MWVAEPQGVQDQVSYSLEDSERLRGEGLAVGYVTLFVGLEILGPVKTTMLMNTEPILTIIGAALLLGEWLSSAQLLGAGLVMVGITLVTRGSGKK